MFNSAEYFMQLEQEKKYRAMMQEATQDQLRDHYKESPVPKFDSGPYYQQVSLAKAKVDSEFNPA